MIETVLSWLYDNLYNYMIPICALCVLRIVVCLLELNHIRRLRDKKSVFRFVGSQYREIGTFTGILIGSVLVCLLPRLGLLFAAAAAALGVIGYRIGRCKGDEADRLWQEVVNQLSANEQPVNPIHVENNIHGLIDTLDVFDEAPAEDAQDASPTQPNQ